MPTHDGIPEGLYESDSLKLITVSACSDVEGGNPMRCLHQDRKYQYQGPQGGFSSGMPNATEYGWLLIRLDLGSQTVSRHTPGLCHHISTVPL